MGISVRIGENLSSLIFPCAHLPNLTPGSCLVLTKYLVVQFIIYRVDGCSVRGFGSPDPLDPRPMIASSCRTNIVLYLKLQLQRTEMNFEKVSG